jgi:hypothetical protein
MINIEDPDPSGINLEDPDPSGIDLEDPDPSGINIEDPDPSGINSKTGRVAACPTDGLSGHQEICMVSRMAVR